MSGLLFDKVALVTGASRGVGYAAARKLCEKFPGGEVVILYVVSNHNLLSVGATIYLATKNQTITPELNKKMRDDFPGASEHCEYVHLDVTKGETVEAVKEMIVARHDTLDILINNRLAKSENVPPTADFYPNLPP